jgi:hypothetical protein
MSKYTVKQMQQAAIGACDYYLELLKLPRPDTYSRLNILIFQDPGQVLRIRKEFHVPKSDISPLYYMNLIDSNGILLLGRFLLTTEGEKCVIVFCAPVDQEQAEQALNNAASDLLQA